MKMKKLMAAVMSCALISAQLPAIAEEVHPRVTVDERLIAFEDQEPVISDKDDTLVPVRGVFEAMGASVEWNGEERSVYVKAKDNIVRLKMYIDNPVITKYTLTSVTTVENEEITVTTAPTLMNERTMIPLRVIAENFGAKIDWSQESKDITIKTKEYLSFIEENSLTGENGSKEYNARTILPEVTIEADKQEVKADEEITVSVKLANTDKIKNFDIFGGLVATVYYDSSKLEFVSVNAVVNGNDNISVLGANNPDFMKDSMKYVYVLMPSDNLKNIAKLSDGTAATIKFKSINGEKTQISLSDRRTKLGYDTYVLVMDENNESTTLSKASELYVDTTPVEIN